MNLLSRTEELILLAVCNLGENAYGVTVREYLRETAGQKFSIGGIYVPLDRLVAKRMLKARQGAPTPERGGMSKRYYTITAKGVKALQEARRVNDLLWKKVPKLTFSGEV